MSAMDYSSPPRVYEEDNGRGGGEDEEEEHDFNSDADDDQDHDHEMDEDDGGRHDHDHHDDEGSVAHSVDQEDVDQEDEDDDDDDDDDEDDEDDEEEDDAIESSTIKLIRAKPSLGKNIVEKYREVGIDSICWTLSTAKPGNGVEQIRDNNNDTYWQSDGSQPHFISIYFQRRVALSFVCLYLDYNLDESYTPKRLSVEVGMTQQDLYPAIYPEYVELSEPVGWCVIPLRKQADALDNADEDNDNNGDNDDDDDNDDGGGDDDDDEDNNDNNNRKNKKNRYGYNSKNIVRTHLLQIGILSMHQNGRDTHIRQVKLFGPRRTNTSISGGRNIITGKKSSSSSRNTRIATASTSGDDDNTTNDNTDGTTNDNDISLSKMNTKNKYNDDDDDDFGSPLTTHFSTVTVSQFSTIR